MPPEKTDPLAGLLQKQGGTIGAIIAIVLILVGPGAGIVGARYVAPDCTDLAAKVQADHDANVQLRSDVARLAETIGDVRRIEEAAHPRRGVPPNDP